MLFEELNNFEWFNEPENVRFDDNALVIYAESGTDFWQSIHRGVSVDNGHFFFCRKNTDFDVTLKWSFDNINKFSQCGLMLRIDERNWLKVSLMRENKGQYVIESVLSSAGHSDLAECNFDKVINDIWFKLQRKGDDYILFYSTDENNFSRLRMFYMPNYGEIKVGAYIANPGQEEFYAKLSDIKFVD